MAVSGRKIKVARCRLIRSSASPASADQASAVDVGPLGWSGSGSARSNLVAISPRSSREESNNQGLRCMVFGYGVTAHVAGGVDEAVRAQRRQASAS